LKPESTDTMKERIIRESIRLFLKTSYKGTSIQQITDILGITKGAFYWHFKSKEELLETIIDKYDKEFLQKLYVYMDGFRGDFTRKFKEYHKFINGYALDNTDICVLFVTLSAEMAGSNTPAEDRIKSVLKKYIDFIVSLLKLGKDEGLFKDGYNVSLNAHIVLAIHSGMLLQWYINRKEINGQTLARTYRDLILHGMIGNGE
jgi:AcrR family transcriptional regulator